MDNHTTIPLWRTCTKCGIEYPLTPEHWHRHTRSPHGLYLQCKICRRAVNRRWNANNRERCKATTRVWREANREHLRQYNEGDKHRQASMRWQRANRDAMRAIKQRRRARERGLPNTFTQDDWQRAVDYFNGCCAVCGRAHSASHKIAADHWIPLTSEDCPGTTPLNIVPLCHAQKGAKNGCNNGKNDLSPETWLLRKFGNHEAAKILARIAAYFEWVKS